MTDNDIIEALECCAVLNSCDKCPWCSLDVADCTTLLAQGCLALINRQKAEIDDLKRDDLPRCKDALRRANEIGMGLQEENQKLKAEIEDLKDKNEHLFVIATEARTKAIEEFIKHHREIMLAFCDDDDQISIKVCEYDANTNYLAKGMMEEWYDETN